MKREVDETGLKLSITEGGKEGKRQVISSCSYLKERFQECSNREGVVMATSVETLGGDLRRREPSSSNERRSEEEKV